jgi:parallel beta-helix repeat protein
MHRPTRTLLSLAGAALLMLLAGAAQANTLHVPSQYATIQAAINSAIAGDTVQVAAGTYREALSWVGKDLTLQGAGAGRSIIDPSAANGGPGGGCLSTQNLTSASLIEGFTLQNGIGDVYGGGMYNSSSSPAVTNCAFSGNSAHGPVGPWDVDGGSGGGMYNNPSSSPVVTSCIFSGNAAVYGGGMYNSSSSSPEVTNCTFSGNAASSIGGGMYNSTSSPAVTNCTFSGNAASYAGGGMYNASSSGPEVTNCTFSGNAASYSGGFGSRGGYGGGMYNSTSSPAVTNCTFSGNAAYYYGGGMYNDSSSLAVTNCTFSGNAALSGGGGMYNISSSPTVTNSILWGNWASPGGISNSGSNPTVRYSEVQDLANSTPDANGNFAADPLFVRNPSPGPDGVWGTADDDYGDLRLREVSPCINAGANTAVTVPPFPMDPTNTFIIDLAGNPRILGGIVDLGAYELFVAPPAAPTNVVASAGSGQVSLTWAASAGATSYDVLRSTVSGGPYTLVKSGIVGTSYVDAGLTNGTTYYYVVQAANAGSTSPNSAQVSATPVAPPAAPTNVVATASNAQVSLTWAASAGATSYNVLRATASGGPYTLVKSGTVATSYVDQGLTNGTTYYYVVQAVNAGGTSPNSTQVSATPVAPPAAPTNLTATASSGQVSLTWAASPGATTYLVRRSTAAGGPFTAIWGWFPATSFVDKGLTNGTTYYYVVQAANKGGTSPYSAPVSAKPGAFPPAPTNVSASGGNGTVNLTWSASAGATSYNVLRSTVSGGPYTTVPGGSGIVATSFVDKGLTNGTTYYYVVQAVNAVGTSPNSAQVSATPVAPPAAPTNVVATASSGQVSLTWTGSPGATSYLVRRSTVSGGPYTAIWGWFPATSYVDKGLTSGTTYYYVVQAANKGGISPYSAQVSATP